LVLHVGTLFDKGKVAQHILADGKMGAPCSACVCCVALEIRLRLKYAVTNNTLKHSESSAELVLCVIKVSLVQHVKNNETQATILTNIFT